MPGHHREPLPRGAPLERHPVRDQARRVLYDEGAPEGDEQGEHPWVGLQQAEDDLTGARPTGVRTPSEHRYGDRRAIAPRRGPSDK